MVGCFICVALLLPFSLITTLSVPEILMANWNKCYISIITAQKFFEKSKNTLDKLEFLWENIVLEVPISLTNNSGTTLRGEGWELNNDSDEDEIDPRLAKLNDLFKGGE